ncbi:hypothetical protein BaRGS_00037416, partial [Batillaria attramentaria]
VATLNKLGVPCGAIAVPPNKAVLVIAEGAIDKAFEESKVVDKITSHFERAPKEAAHEALSLGARYTAMMNGIA